MSFATLFKLFKYFDFFELSLKIANFFVFCQVVETICRDENTIASSSETQHPEDSDSK